METLLHVGLSNMAVATALALLAASVGCVFRRPALVHSLWLLVLLKLVTPPVVPVRIAWPAVSEANPPPSPVASPAAVAPAFPEDKLDAAPPEPVGPQLLPVLVEGEERPAQLWPAPPATAPPEKPEPGRIPGTLPAPSANPDPIPPSPDWRPIVLWLWLAGCLSWLTLAGVRVVRFRRLLPHARPAPGLIQREAEHLARRLGLRGCPDVWLVAGAIAPMIWSLAGPPRLLLPAGLLERLSAEQRATLLAHELAHLRRRDHWVRNLELLVMALYWWFPLVWWARRELREAEEQCCDAWVVWALPEAARAYALAIVTTLDFLSGVYPARPLAASGMGPVHSLRRRLTMIMRGTTPRALSLAGVLVVLGLGALALPWLPVQAQDRSEKLRDESQDKRQTPGRGADLDQVRREMVQLQEHMRRLQQEVQATEQRFRDAQRRLAEAADRAVQRDNRPEPQPRPGDWAPGPRLPPQPGPDGPPGMPIGPGGPGPMPSGPGMMPPGARPGMGPMAGGAPPGDLDRRLRDMEWKLDALLRQMEELRQELRREGPVPGARGRFAPPAGGSRAREPTPPTPPVAPPSPPAPSR